MSDNITPNPHELLIMNEDLQNQVQYLSEKVEALTQEVHDLRSRLQIAQSVESHYHAEVESFQQNEVKLKDLHETRIQQIKDEHAFALKEWAQKVEGLEQELEEQRKANASCLSQLEEHIKLSKEIADDTVSLSALRAELQEVQSARDDDRQACEQHKELNHILMEEKVELAKQLEFMKEQLETAQARYEIAKNDLTEQAESFDELRATLLVTQSELACLKAAPSDEKSRGNSLFAEVEDRRQAMVKRLSSMTEKYNHMKKEYSAKCAEITKLKAENVLLHQKWEEEDKERDNREVWVIDNYEIRLKELEKTVQSLKQEEKPVFINGDASILKFANHVVETSQKKLEKLQKEMEWRSAERLNEAKALHLARRDLQAIRSQLMSVKAENSLLRDRLEQANITDLPAPRPLPKCNCQSEVSGGGKNKSLAKPGILSSAMKEGGKGVENTHPPVIHPLVKAKHTEVSSLKERPSGAFVVPSSEALAHIAEQSPASRAVNSSLTTCTFSDAPSLATELKEDSSHNSPITSECENITSDIKNRKVSGVLPGNTVGQVMVSEKFNQESEASGLSSKSSATCASECLKETSGISGALSEDLLFKTLKPVKVPVRVLRAKMADAKAAEAKASLSLTQSLTHGSNFSTGQTGSVIPEKCSEQSLGPEVVTKQSTAFQKVDVQLLESDLAGDQVVTKQSTVSKNVDGQLLESDVAEDHNSASKHSSLTMKPTSSSMPDGQAESVDPPANLLQVSKAEKSEMLTADKDIFSACGSVLGQNTQTPEVQVTSRGPLENVENMTTRVEPQKSILWNRSSRPIFSSKSVRNVRFEESDSKPDLVLDNNEDPCKDRKYSAAVKRMPKVQQRNYPVRFIPSVKENVKSDQ